MSLLFGPELLLHFLKHNLYIIAELQLILQVLALHPHIGGEWEMVTHSQLLVIMLVVITYQWLTWYLMILKQMYRHKTNK